MKKPLKLSKKLMRGSSYYGRYIHDELMFAYCGKPDKDNVYQLTSFMSCREDLAGEMYGIGKRRGKGIIQIDKARFLVRIIFDPTEKYAASTTKRFEVSVKTGLRMLNIVEKRYNWPLTKMYDVAPIDIPRRTNTPTSFSDYERKTTRRILMKMIVGSKRWIRSPHMISLFLLLFRFPHSDALAINHRKFEKVKSYSGLVKACKSPYNGGVASDVVYVNNTIKFWDILLGDFDNLFRDMPLKENFSSKAYKDGYSCTEGVDRLCRLCSEHDDLQKRFVAKAKKSKKISS